MNERFRTEHLISSVYAPHEANEYNMDMSLERQLQNYTEDTKKHGKWSQDEDEKLKSVVEEFGERQWRKISERIPGRSAIQCLHRWTKILKPGLVKGPWTREEDERLVEWVKKEGPTKWAQAASYIKGRNGKQCRERWFNNLNPELKRGNWTAEEDKLFYRLYQQHGSSWSKIAKLMPGRTENSIKNRFYSTLRKIAADQKRKNVEEGKVPGIEVTPILPLSPDVVIGQLPEEIVETPSVAEEKVDPKTPEPVATVEEAQLMLAKNFLYLRLLEHQKNQRERMMFGSEPKSPLPGENQSKERSSNRSFGLVGQGSSGKQEGIENFGWRGNANSIEPGRFLDNFLDQVDFLLRKGVSQNDIAVLRFRLQEHLKRVALCPERNENCANESTTHECEALTREEVAILLKMLTPNSNPAPPQILPYGAGFFQTGHFDQLRVSFGRIEGFPIRQGMTSNLDASMKALSGKLHNLDHLLSAARKEMVKLEIAADDPEESVHGKKDIIVDPSDLLEEEKHPLRHRLSSSNHRECSFDSVSNEGLRRRKQSYDLLDDLLHDSRRGLNRKCSEEGIDITPKGDVFGEFTITGK